MPLRSHQQKLKETVFSIRYDQSSEKELFLFWSPGAGKSLAPPILSDLLTNGRKQIWVVPRDSLKEQGEGDYNCEYYPVNKKIRIADNAGDPFRGCDACVTTYQAIGANPEKWVEISEKYNIMLILDEFHHLSQYGEWLKPIEQMSRNTFLSVFMTGTITRGDGTKIPFIPYNAIDIDFSNTDKRKWIIYTREQALKDGAVLDFKTALINGSGSYISRSGKELSFDRFGASGDHLRCAFQTDFAYHLIEYAVRGWKSYRKINPWAKLLIVSPDIETAQDYLNYIKIFHLKAGIATSDDSKECKSNILKFKEANYKAGSLDTLVTVAVAYEGLSVPAITHTVLLTLIRSIQWLEQCLARGTRNHAGKKCGFVIAPDDPRLKAAIKSITSGEILQISAEAEPKEEESEDDEEGSSFKPSQIEALYSSADIDNAPHFDEYIPELKTESQSEIEKRLRKDVNSHINKIVGESSKGNRKIKEQIFWKQAKRIVNNGMDGNKYIKKPLKEMTIPELTLILKFSETYK